jgi:hypothetical protein
MNHGKSSILLVTDLGIPIASRRNRCHRTRVYTTPVFGFRPSRIDLLPRLKTRVCAHTIYQPTTGPDILLSFPSNN